jgi:cyclohexa-1,5-dienecarbonyl-CoA hydratase
MSAVHASADAGLIRIVLDHPPANILTRSVLRELREAVHRHSAEREPRALLLSAAGRHFSAGADVGEHLPPHHESLIPEFLETVAALDRCPVPVIAAVRGRCLGGGFELVLAADIIVASETATFGQPEIALGVAAPAAAAWLPARCGRGVASDLLFTGDALPAADARSAGLVRHVVADAELEARAEALAARITRHSAAALREVKQMVRAGHHDSDGGALTAAGERYLRSLMRTADAIEGLEAFVGKRPAVWRHR